MSFIRNTRISIRVAAGLATTLLLMIALTLVSINRVNSVNSKLSVMNDFNSVKQRYAINFRGSVHDRAIRVRDITLVDAGEQAKVLDDIARLEGYYAISEVELDKMFAERSDMTDEERSINGEIKAAQARATPALKRVVELQLKGDLKGAHVTLMGEARPAFIAWLAAINKFIDLEENKNHTVAASVRDITQGFEIQMLLLCGCALLVGCGFAWWGISSVRPLSSLAVQVRSLAAGDLSVTIPQATAADEVSEIIRAVGSFKDQLLGAERSKAEQTRAIDNVGTGLAALSKGDLTHRISADLAGPFAKLKEDFNGALTRLQDTMKTVLSSASGISTGAGEIAQASDDLSRRTEQNAASLEQTAAALEEITATVKKTAQNAKDATKIVTGAKNAAEEGGRVVETAITAMGQIEQSSKKITDIIGVIDEIAFQTNLLALNAGVEAARAGDAGKGFAVVASEVRALAQRSSEAAREIKTLIKTSGEQVNSGVKLVDESGKALGRIVEQVVQIDILVTEIAQAAQQQSTGIEEVNIAVSQMDQVTQQNAAMVEQSTAASRNLASDTNELAEIVSLFDVGSGSAAAKKMTSRAPPRPAQAAPRAAPKPQMKTVATGGARAGGAQAGRAPPQAAAEDWQEF